jgi:hypothetical protein
MNPILIIQEPLTFGLLQSATICNLGSIRTYERRVRIQNDKSIPLLRRNTSLCPSTNVKFSENTKYFTLILISP